MKVMFVGSVHTIGTSVETHLTKGKWYETGLIDSESYSKYYLIDNDYNQKRRYKAEYFMTSEQVRNNKLEQLKI